MNLIQSAPLWLIGILVVLVLVAAVQDVIQLKVSNLTVAGVIIAAIFAALVAGVSLSIWQNLLVFFVVLAGGTFLFASGNVGGGDVKLFAAVALWVDLQRAVWLIAAIFIAGGLLAMIVIAPRIFGGGLKFGAGRSSRGIPYAVAIATGTLLVVAAGRLFPATPHHPNPLQIPTISTVR